MKDKQEVSRCVSGQGLLLQRTQMRKEVLNNRNLLFIRSGGWKPKTKVSPEGGPSEAVVEGPAPGSSA